MARYSVGEGGFWVQSNTTFLYHLRGVGGGGVWGGGRIRSHMTTCFRWTSQLFIDFLTLQYIV